MDQAGAVFDRDVIGQHDLMGTFAELCSVDQVKWPLVFEAFELAARDGSQHRRLRPDSTGDEWLRHQHRSRSGHLNHCVIHLGVHGDGGVGHQGPRGGGPHQQIEIVIDDREAHVDARVDDVVVALSDLMVGQRGLAARAVRRHPRVLDE
jgi:hypothetical protein